MTGKEKLAHALRHEEAPVLLDIGGMPTTGMHCIVAEKLREYYGLEKHPVKILEPVQMLAFIEDDLKEALGVQTTPLWSDSTILGFKQTTKFKEWRTPWGQDVLVSDGFVTSSDGNGNTFIYARGNTAYPPTGKMPQGGFYFDNIMRAPAFDEDDYNIEDNFEEFGPVSRETLDWLKTERTRVEGTGDAVVGNLGGTAFGDIALVPGPQLLQPKGIRDIEEWYMSIVARPEDLRKIFDYQLRFALENLEKMHSVLGESIQTAYICGTDFGTQNSPFCSTDTFRGLYKPYYKAVNEWIHTHTTWKTFKHSCGSIMPLIPELTDCGFDLLNPVQWTANNMGMKELKQKFGDRIVFWGGGVNPQKTLPHGTAREVMDEALECCRVFGKNGGFVFNTIHNIQPDVPAENVAAIADAVRIYNGER